MAILDQYNNPVYSHSYTRKPAKSANLAGGERPSYDRNLKDLGKLVPKFDRQSLCSISKQLYLNSPPLIGAIDQKGMYSVGNAYLPVYKGSDHVWGKAARDWLEGEWYEICNVAGGNNDFSSDLYIDSVAMDRDGEVFEYFTQTKSGYPQIQIIPSHRIDAGGLPEGRLAKGVFSGSKFYHEDGIVYWSDSNKPVAYSFVDANGGHERFIDASLIKHTFDKSWPEQKRGLPLFYATLNNLRDILQSEEWERGTLLNMSSEVYTIHNETGGPDTDDPTYIPSDDLEAPTIQYMQGGRIRYARAGAGEKIEQHQNFRPGNPWLDFNEFQMRLCFQQINWPMSMSWKASGQGTAERNDIGKACRAVKDRQTILDKIAKWRITRALVWAMKTGRIPQSSDWYNWAFTHPPSLTIDDGRSSKEKIEKLKMGILNQTDLVGEEGKSLEEHLMERGQEIVIREKIRLSLEKEHGMKIDPRYFMMLTPNEQPVTDEGAGSQDGESAPNESENERMKFDNLKAKFDAYGVAVRAGAITPADVDEEAFRKEANLPPMTPAVRGAWKEDKGYRRPITLLQKVVAATGFGGPKKEDPEEE